MLTSLWLLSQYQGNVNVDAHLITNYLFPQFNIDAMLYGYSGAPKKVRIDEEDQEFIGEFKNWGEAMMYNSSRNETLCQNLILLTYS